jgi:xylulose-5-phosphate/fructose-6-phosphate phosphoketolase
LLTPGRSAGQASGCPSLIHRRTNHAGLHVRGFNEEGTTTTPFDMVMLNDLDRFHLVMDVIDRVPGLAQRAVALRQHMADERLRHRSPTGRGRHRHPARAARLTGSAVAAIRAEARR